ncbi:unnamed protein product [Bursaphelenchus okinawaensis]|uniref:Thioredoxin n=1 Tax=Bursaphelenchus okinawaensis TaxID=465554 RepID=A0A811JV99_9BILA|nr:unnamed protein product [Bursaphelenchus okinawaensis]CAG9085578.1 unnamed protein product [Bursaphelenchus okinawaensis]
MPVTEIESKKQLQEILEEAGDKLVVVKFFATWCGPCRMMAPKFLKLSNENENVVCVEVDVDEQEELVQEYDVNVMPTFVFVKKGQENFILEGNNFEELKKNLQERS